MNQKEKRLINTEKFLAIVLTFAGIALLYVGALSAPVGEISTSILVAFGEVMTFVGAILGIDYSYKKILHKVINNNKESKNENSID